MNQTDRIRHMEQILDEAEAALRALDSALERYESLRPAIGELSAYYQSPLWRQDYEDDCAGRIPGDLQRGVLSEDAVYNLLTGLRALSHRFGLEPIP